MNYFGVVWEFLSSNGFLAAVIALFGFYLHERLKGLATKHQFKSAIEQLNTSTKVVESIKAQLGEKLWINQQVWDTKRVAYEELIDGFCKTEGYLRFLLEFMSEYQDAYYHPFPEGYGEGDDNDDLDFCHHIENLKSDFEKKYENPFKNKEKVEQRRMDKFDTKEKLQSLERMLAQKSIYLPPDMIDVGEAVKQVSDDVFDSYHGMDGLTPDESLQATLDAYKEAQVRLIGLIERVKEIASRDLRLGAEV